MARSGGVSTHVTASTRPSGSRSRTFLNDRLMPTLRPRCELGKPSVKYVS